MIFFERHCIGLTEEPPENQNWYCHKCGTKTEQMNQSRNEIEIDVESHEPNDMNEIQNNLMNYSTSHPSDYLTSLKNKKKKKT